jgi:hypothetical protein
MGDKYLMADIHVEGNEPLIVRTYEHLSTQASTQNVEQKFVAKENGVEYTPHIKYIGPSKDDPDFIK